MTTLTKCISSIQVDKRYGISQPIAWFFMQKVRVAMQSSQKYPLSQIDHVHEFVVGANEDEK